MSSSAPSSSGSRGQGRHRKFSPPACLGAGEDETSIRVRVQAQQQQKQQKQSKQQCCTYCPSPAALTVSSSLITRPYCLVHYYTSPAVRVGTYVNPDKVSIILGGDDDDDGQRQQRRQKQRQQRRTELTRQLPHVQKLFGEVYSELRSEIAERVARGGSSGPAVGAGAGGGRGGGGGGSSSRSASGRVTTSCHDCGPNRFCRWWWYI